MQTWLFTNGGRRYIFDHKGRMKEKFVFGFDNFFFLKPVLAFLNIEPVSETIRANVVVDHWAISNPLGISERSDGGVQLVVVASGKVLD